MTQSSMARPGSSGTNLKTALVLLSIAAAFFAGIVFKYWFLS